MLQLRAGHSNRLKARWGSVAPPAYASYIFLLVEFEIFFYRMPCHVDVRGCVRMHCITWGCINETAVTASSVECRIGEGAALTLHSLPVWQPRTLVDASQRSVMAKNCLEGVQASG